MLVNFFSFSQLGSDVGFEKGDVLVPPVSSDYHKMFDGFPIGGTFFNYGTNNEDSVYISVHITNNAGYDFADTIGPVNINAGDSIRVFEGETYEFTSFSTSPNSFNQGDYVLVYKTSINNDQNFSNNEVTLPFTLWSNQYHTIAPSGVLPSEQRLHQIYPKPDTALTYQACVIWEDPNESYFVSNPYSYVLTDVDVVAKLDSGHTFFGTEIFVNVYDWSDPWLDLDDPSFQTQNGAFQDLQLLQSGIYYPVSETQNNTTVTVPLQTYIYQNDYTRYLVCAQTFDEHMNFGFDTTTSFKTNYDELRQPIGIVESNNNWHLVNPNRVPTIAPRFSLFTGLEEKQLNVLECFPNPSQELLTIKTPLNGNCQIQICDLSGRLVEELKNRSTNGNISVNTGNLTQGHYVISLMFSSGERYFARFQKQ